VIGVQDVKIGCGQITWFGRDLPLETILDEIARAGYEGTPARRNVVPTASELVAYYARFGLKPTPLYIGFDWWKPELRPQQLENAAEQAAFTRELGLAELYVASNLTPERRSLSGQVSAQDETSVEQLKRFADLLNEVGRITQQEGVSICFHNHVGSPVETREEVDRLFSLVDRSHVFQGADLGHLAWAGADVVQFVRDYAPSIRTLHIKDIYPSVLAEGRAQRWDYSGFSKHGIFAELGEGMVDFPAVFDILESAGFAGWIVVETDVTTKPTPLESAQISRAYLRSIGH
jgi:inosose dehydratase